MATDRGIQKADLLEIKFKRKIFPVQQEINPKSLVTAIRQDRHDPATYWIGLNGSGLVQWNREKNTFHLISEKQGLSGKNVYDLRQDTKGNLWIAVNNRLDFWEVSLNKWHHYTDFLVSKNTFQAVTTVYQDKQNRIWVGTSEDGVFKLDPQTNKLLPWSLGEVLSLGNPLRVHKFEEDTRQRIWVSTNRGMFRIDPARQQTEKITLHPLNQHIQPSDRLQSTLKIDSKGNLWSSGIGFLAKADLNGQVIQTYTQENGLQADHIFSIEEDNAGMLWMATDNFLHRLDPQSGEFTYFRKENGLYANRIDTWINKDASGELFLGFTNAFNHFVPEQVMYNRLQQPLVITEIKIDNKKHWPGNSPSVSIHPSENTFSIAFALLNYSLPEKNQYAFMLEGFDKNWTMTENRHATYTNLSPGNYTFKVKAANNDGVWNEQGITLPIKVIPAFYQTWWFFLLIAALAVGIISIIFRYREQNRLRLEGIRNRIATDLHDDMGSTLSSIRIFSDVVQKQIAPVQPEAVPILQRISSSATTLSESMQDIIWTIQSRHDSLDDVVTRMREFGLKMAEARGVEFKMQISDKFQTTRLDVEQRRNVYLIFKETINNAIKYAECTQISVVLEVSGRNLYLQITDNGKGFDLATIRQGNGLQNLQKRAHEIGGKLSIQSAPGAGTSIELQVRLTS
jgi:streptogramin lyase